MGNHICTNVNPGLQVSHAFATPENDGVRLQNPLTLNLRGPGAIDHIVNDTGGPVRDRDAARQVVNLP